MPRRISNEQLIEDFLRGYSVETIAYFRKAPEARIHEVLREALSTQP